MENERKFLICPKCGSEIEITENQNLGHCTFCDSLVPLPFFITNKESFDSVTYKNMLNRVNKATSFNLSYQFHRAFNLFDKLIKNYYNLGIEDYYPYFGKALAQYGVCYALNDKLENDLICLKIVKESIFENENYLRAISLADVNTEAILKQTASMIEQFQKDIKKELIDAEIVDVTVLVDDSNNNPNAKVDLAIAERIKEKAEKNGYKVIVTTNLFRMPSKEFVSDVYKQINIANHLVVVSTNVDHLNNELYRHVWMSYYIEDEIAESIVDRMSIITDNVEVKDSLPVNNIEFFGMSKLDDHLQFLHECLKKIPSYEEKYLQIINQNNDLQAKLNEGNFEEVKNFLNDKLNNDSLTFNEWWLMFLAKHQISKIEDIENKAINLKESYYFQKAFIASPRYLKRIMREYYLKCNEALEKLAIVDEEYEKEIEVAQKKMFKSNIIELCFTLIPVIIATVICYWTFSIASLIQLLLCLIINGIGYTFIIKKLITIFNIGRISRSIQTKEEEEKYFQQIKKGLKAEQAAKFIATKLTKKLHLIGIIIMTLSFAMTFSYLIKESVIRITHSDISYYYVFDKVVITGGNSEELIIPKTIDNRSVNRIKEHAFESNENIKKVTINNGVKEIGKFAFKNCKNLKEVIVPASIAKMGETPFVESNNIKEFLYQGSFFTPAQFLGEDYQTEMYVNFVSNNE